MKYLTGINNQLGFWTDVCGAHAHMHVDICVGALVWRPEGDVPVLPSHSLPYIPRPNCLLMNPELTNFASLFNQLAPQGSLFSNSPKLGIYTHAGDLNSGLYVCMTTSPQPLLNKMHNIELSKRKQFPKSPPATHPCWQVAVFYAKMTEWSECFVHSELSYKQCQCVFFPSRVCRKGKYFFHPTLTPQSSWGVFSISGWLIINWIFYTESQEATFYEGQKWSNNGQFVKLTLWVYGWEKEGGL